MSTPGGPAFRAMMRGQGWDFKKFRSGLRAAGLYDDGYVDNHTPGGGQLKGEFRRRRLDRRAYDMSYPSGFPRGRRKTAGRSNQWSSGNRGFVPVNRVIPEYAPQYRYEMPPTRKGMGRSAGLYRGYSPSIIGRGRRVRDRDEGFNSPPSQRRRY